MTEPTVPPTTTSAIVLPPLQPPKAPPRLLDPKKSFQNVDAAERLKGYLRDVPVLHARLEKVVVAQEVRAEAARKLVELLEAQVADGKKTLEELRGVAESIQATVERWEKEEKADGR